MYYNYDELDQPHLSDIRARKGNFPFDEIMTKFSKGASDNKIAYGEVFNYS